MCCRNITLLHYIITVLEKKYPKVATFSEELHNVPDAAKIKYVCQCKILTIKYPSSWLLFNTNILNMQRSDWMQPENWILDNRMTSKTFLWPLVMIWPPYILLWGPLYFSSQSVWFNFPFIFPCIITPVWWSWRRTSTLWDQVWRAWRRWVQTNREKHTLSTGPLPRLTAVPSVLQELKFQQTQSSHLPKDKFVSVVSQFITVASFSFSEVEESFLEAKQVVRRSWCGQKNIHWPEQCAKIPVNIGVLVYCSIASPVIHSPARWKPTATFSLWWKIFEKSE